MALFTWYSDADRKTRRIFWTCSAGWALDMADSVIYSYLIPLLMTALGMSLVQAGFISSANFFSAALGGWIGGWLCDRFGRARILQLTILWFSAFSFISGFAQNYEQLLLFRVLQGLGFGAEWAVGAVLLGELIDPKHRGKALGIVHSGAAVGSAIAAVLAGPVASAFAPDWGWRIVFWSGIVPALLIFLVRKDSDDSEIFKRARERAEASGKRHSLAAIFQPRVVRMTALAALLSLGVQGAAYSISNYLTPFLTAERGLTQAMAGWVVTCLSIGGFFGFITNAYLSDRIGRRNVFRLFGGGFVIMSLTFVLTTAGASAQLVALIACIYGFFQFGMYASFGAYFTELFPTELRGAGQAFAYNFGRAGSAFFVMFVPLVALSTGLGPAMGIMGAVGIVIVIGAIAFLPETAGSELHDLAETQTTTGEAREGPVAPLG